MGDQMEAFEVTDYDLESEFNPHARRGFRQTREERIYGVFADDSGDEKAGPSKPKRKPNYSAPLGFVKGGIHQVGKDAVPTKKSDDEDDDGDGPPAGSSDEDEAAPRLGAGLPRAFGSGPKQRRFQSSGAGPSREEIAGLRSTGGAGPTAGLGDIGHWEKHTKGIGAKLLKQMGFREGGGLGKNLQGISTPVEAKLRKGRGAIGAYGTEKPASRPTPAADKEGDEPEREFKEKLGQWRRGPRRKKVDYVYKTLDEVLQEGKTRTLKPGVSSSGGDLARTKVIDMTGREQRVLSGYHAIHGQRAPPQTETAADDDSKRTFDMPELLHNINLMVDLCEQDIIRSDRSLRYERDRQVTLEHEEAQLSETIERHKSQLERVEDVSRAVDYMEAHKPGSENPSPLDVMSKMFLKLKTDYPIEFDVFDLDYLAVDYVFPLVKELLNMWNPLKNPKFATEVFAELKESLESSDKPQMEYGTPVDVYHRLLWELWMPPVRQAISLWQPKLQPELTQLLELWRPVLPRWIFDNVCDQLLMPRLQTEVDAWNPLTDAVPIHSWIHPWMPIMDQRLESVYPTIRHKLASALLAWHPSDRSARLILSPWVGVMAPGSLEAFLVKNILPKLQLAMSELVVNPNQQVLDQWNWVMDWEELLSPVHLVSILDKLFFPKWLQVLVTWLNHAPNYEEVTKWYLGWKQLIPEKLVGHAVVREHLNTGLQLMNRAASNPGQAVSYQELSHLLASSTPPPPPQPAPTPSQIRNREDLTSAIRTASGSVTIGFRDLLERRCEERGILFHPLPGKFHEGKPVLRCGGLSIYLDRSVIFVNDGGVWVPSSLQSVLDKAALTSV